MKRIIRIASILSAMLIATAALTALPGCPTGEGEGEGE